MEFLASLGITNTFLLNDGKVVENMREVQRKNVLFQTFGLQGRQFSIEMETGTDKVYTYTKTIYELNHLYDFTKPITAVPSVTIREGVYKSLQVTQEHSSVLYGNASCRYFIYNSAKLSDVWQFVTSVNIEIMVININTSRKAENVIDQQQDKLNGDAAINHIQATCPIVITDEPQSVDNTQEAKATTTSPAPLCILRYPATHQEKADLLYRLTPADVYQMGLVRQICVSGNQAVDDPNKPHIKLPSVSNKDGFKARPEIGVRGKDGRVSHKAVIAKPDADLYELSGYHSLYKNYVVSGIDCTLEMEQIELFNTDVVRLGHTIGDVDKKLIKRMQIRRTIEAYLDKELHYIEKSIKVLFLFFIDEVKKYRNPEGGKSIYMQTFEELYAELMGLPEYAPLREYFTIDTNRVYDGYFSQGKKGNYKDTRGDIQDDTNTYNTIMKDKEWLLFLGCPSCFISLHSTLKEGWDNSNVFQICTLVE